MLIPTHKLHHKFSEEWEEYKRSDLTKVCKSLIRLMGKQPKGNGIDQVRRDWASVCNFIIQWNGKK